VVEATSKSSDKNKMALKDWVTLSLSLMALLISGVTAYFSIIRQVDDLRVIVEGSAYEDHDKDEIRVSTKIPLTMTFANLGNRPAAVTSMWLWLNQPKTYDERQECFGEQPKIQAGFDVQPFIVEGGKIATQIASIKAEKFSVDISEDNHRSPLHYVTESCITFTIITADGNVVRNARRIDLSELRMENGNPIWTSWQRKQIILYQKWSNIFQGS
jgi:hypothetical protein